MPEPSKEESMARIAELENQVGPKKHGSLEFKVGEKGGVSVYGLGRFCLLGAVVWAWLALFW